MSVLGRPAKIATLLIMSAAAALGMASICAAQTAASRIDEALQNITTLVRAGRIGYATVWDGNKYVQCRRMPSREFHCEAAGATMQPSLQRVLTPERLSRLAALGWTIDPSFGNYTQTFPADVPTSEIADYVLSALTEGYDADVSELELQTTWVADVPCPQRNGPSQNLAGSINDAPAMRATAVWGCSYKADIQKPRLANSSADLLTLYGTRTTAEIQRLRVNAAHNVYVVFSAGIGYIQCRPETPPLAIYCEAQSAESWPALAAVLTAERIALLKGAGYRDPGRAPNYSKSYPFDKFNDAAIANEILTILYDVYGYRGSAKLKISTD